MRTYARHAHPSAAPNGPATRPGLVVDRDCQGARRLHAPARSLEPAPRFPRCADSHARRARRRAATVPPPDAQTCHEGRRKARLERSRPGSPNPRFLAARGGQTPTDVLGIRIKVDGTQEETCCGTVPAGFRSPAAITLAFEDPWSAPTMTAGSNAAFRGRSGNDPGTPHLGRATEPHEPARFQRLRRVGGDPGF